MFARQEYVAIKTKPGQAKVFGTIICVGGAMVLSFYHGKTFGIPNSSIHWKYAEKMSEENSGNKSNLILGSIAIIASSISWAAWVIIQVSTLYFENLCIHLSVLYLKCSINFRQN